MHVEKMGYCYLVVIHEGKQVAVVDMQNGQFLISFSNCLDIHLVQDIMNALWEFKNHPW